MRYFHVKCVGLNTNSNSCQWTCCCALPNFSDSCFDDSVNSPITLDVSNEEIGESVTIAEELSAKLQKYTRNIPIAHLNTNSVAGFKFAESKFFIQENLFDIIVLGETKIDDSFPDSQFYIKGFRMLRKDRNRYGGGLLIYISRIILVYYCKCCNLIGYSTRYLFLDRQRVAKQSSSYRDFF